MQSQPTRVTGTVAHDFARTDMTWASYLLLGYFGYLQAVLGPVMPFLRHDLRLSYAAGGLHFSAFAAGMIVAGLTGARVMAWLGRPVVFWGGAVGMALGAVLVVVGGRLALTVAGAGVMGLFGTLLVVTIQAVLSDQHGRYRTRALTEANIGASLASGLAALLVGLCQGVGLGWRAALLIPIALFVLIAARYRRAPLPPRAAGATQGHRPAARLPLLFWLYWVVVVFSVAAEWSLTFWGTDYLHHVIALDTGVAATVMGLYLFGTVLARVLGSRLTRTVPSAMLLVAATGVALAGFLVFWLAPHGPLTIIGLAVTGLGIANLFPLALATGLGIAPESSDTTSARISLGAGLAIFVAPLSLGGLADHVGIRVAYGVVPLLLCAAGVAALGALLLGRRGPDHKRSWQGSDLERSRQRQPGTPRGARCVSRPDRPFKVRPLP